MFIYYNFFETVKPEYFLKSLNWEIFLRKYYFRKGQAMDSDEGYLIHWSPIFKTKTGSPKLNMKKEKWKWWNCLKYSTIIKSIHFLFIRVERAIQSLRIELKGALSSLRQFLATEISLKMMKKAFHFIIKALLVLKIFKLSYWIFTHVKKRLD